MFRQSICKQKNGPSDFRLESTVMFCGSSYIFENKRTA
ncbi:hypothetical protein LEP1GSC052_2417 [Leptospira kmetyi serovar Malaysia str. Bejo-Iso9]|nr:hypothetical protein LEP1GSC052_2417 [Leptospira kmetyi serovar Malaysia str. Bejo-Iso9]